MIYYFTPYALDKKLAEAFNHYCSLVPNDDDWICLFDGDTLRLQSDWGHIIHRYIQLYPDTDCFSCVTNRIGTSPQKYEGRISKDPNVINHYNIAKNLYAKKKLKVTNVDKRLAGFMLLFKKSVWNKVKFRGNYLLGVDVLFTGDLLARKMKVRIMEGFYLFHYYRLDRGGVKHKKHLLQKKCIYTCITGNYDTLKNPVNKLRGTDFICFTNNKRLKSNMWNIKYIDNKEGLDNIRLARKVKILSHKYLPHYDTTVWIDGAYHIQLKHKEFINNNLGRKDLFLMKHANRNCIYEEAKTCIQVGKGIKEEIEDQIKRYRDNNFPADMGLYDTSIMIRRFSEEINAMNELWWKEFSNGCTRDQISLPYVLNALNIKDNVIKVDRNNFVKPRFKKYKHVKKI